LNSSPSFVESSILPVNIKCPHDLHKQKKFELDRGVTSTNASHTSQIILKAYALYT